MLWRLKSLMLGVILGLLFSPGTGMENRRRLWLWLQGAAGQAAPKVQTQLQQVATKGATVASQTLDQARQQVAPITQRAQETLSTAGQAAQQKIGQVTSQATSRFGDAAAPVSPPPVTGASPAPVTAPTPDATVTGVEQNAKTVVAANRAGDQTDGQKQSSSAAEAAGYDNKTP
jgi:hypothetical protein